jgi:hypothetical protein
MQALAEGLGANAIVGIDLDYETIQVGKGGSMLMVTASGTAVPLRQRRRSASAGRESAARARASGVLVPAATELRIWQADGDR